MLLDIPLECVTSKILRAYTTHHLLLKIIFKICVKPLSVFDNNYYFAF